LTFRLIAQVKLTQKVGQKYNVKVFMGSNLQSLLLNSL
jgi:hypothetical protein